MHFGHGSLSRRNKIAVEDFQHLSFSHSGLRSLEALDVGTSILFEKSVLLVHSEDANFMDLECPFCSFKIPLSPRPRACPNCNKSIRDIKSKITEEAEAKRKLAILLDRHDRSNEIDDLYGPRKDFATLMPIKFIERINREKELSGKKQWVIVAEAMDLYFKKLDLESAK